MSEQNLKYTCCFCGLPFYGYGNNAEPVIKNGVCCNECNKTKVIPARIKSLESPAVTNEIEKVNDIKEQQNEEMDAGERVVAGLKFLFPRLFN